MIKTKKFKKSKELIQRPNQKFQLLKLKRKKRRGGKTRGIIIIS
jgi:hypothetical protein